MLERLLWLVDENVNHKLPKRLFQRWLCDWNDRVIVAGGVITANNFLGRRGHR